MGTGDTGKDKRRGFLYLLLGWDAPSLGANAGPGECKIPMDFRLSFVTAAPRTRTCSPWPQWHLRNPAAAHGRPRRGPKGAGAHACYLNRPLHRFHHFVSANYIPAPCQEGRSQPSSVAPHVAPLPGGDKLPSLALATESLCTHTPVSGGEGSIPQVSPPCASANVGKLLLEREGTAASPASTGFAG